MQRGTLLRFALALAMLVACGDDGGGGPSGPAPAPGGPEMGALVSGRSAYIDGVFVWTDYAYDDHGPNADAVTGGDRTNSSTAGGDSVYPPSAAPGNAADLIQLQISLHRGQIALWAILETLVDPAVPVVGVAFDTDADPATGAAALPGGRWPVDGSLGVEALVEISSDGARLWTYANGGWTAGPPFDSVVAPEKNLIGTTVPSDRLAPGDGTWRVAAAVGIATNAGTWLDGAADIYDLAFVGNEPFVRWQDNRQADILAGVLDASEATAQIDFARMRSSETTPAAAFAPGFHSLLYRSALTLGEGVLRDEDNSPSFLGPYQPYLVYVPEDLPGPTPLSVFLHGANQNHLGSVYQPPDDLYIGTGRALSEDPHLIAILGFAGDGFDFAPHMLQVYPLGRGLRLGYRGIGHQDVLDVVDDAQRRFDIDPDRVILQGASMGGIGTYRIGVLQPDRWSVMLPLIGYQSEDLLPLMVNLRNIPVRQINGLADPLVPEPPATASAAKLDELEYDYIYWLLTDRGHEAGGYVYDCVFAGAVDYVRERNPAHVVYAVDSSLDTIDPETGLNLRFDSAYWVSGIRARDSESLARVDATSLSLPRFAERAVHIDVVLDNVASGLDLCGPNPDVQTGDEWRERAVFIIAGDELPRENRIVVRLDNVSQVTLDVARAALDASTEGSVVASSDDPAELTLRGLARGQRVRVGESEHVADDDGAVTVAIAGGETVVVISP